MSNTERNNTKLRHHTVHVNLVNIGKTKAPISNFQQQSAFQFIFDAEGKELYEIDLDRFVNVLRQAIQVALKDGRKLVISHFELFAVPKGLSLLEELANTKVPLAFDDYPQIDDMTLPGVIVQQRVTQKLKGDRKAIDGRQENSGKHLLEAQNQRKKVRRKLQKVFANYNNRAALQHLVAEAKEGITLNELALSLYDHNILTATGKGHTPKSVSRLKEKVEMLEQLFRDIPATDILQNLHQINQRAYEVSPILERETYGVMGTSMQQKEQVLEKVWEQHQNRGTQAPSEAAFSPESPNRKGSSTKRLKLVPLIWPESEVGEIVDFKERMTLHFTEPLKDVQLSIYPPFRDYEEGLDSYEYQISGTTQQIDIDFVKDTYLLPGRYYLFIKANRYQPILKAFTIHRDLAPLSTTP